MIIMPPPLMPFAAELGARLPSANGAQLLQLATSWGTLGGQLLQAAGTGTAATVQVAAVNHGQGMGAFRDAIMSQASPNNCAFKLATGAFTGMGVLITMATALIALKVTIITAVAVYASVAVSARAAAVPTAGASLSAIPPAAATARTTITTATQTATRVVA